MLNPTKMLRVAIVLEWVFVAAMFAAEFTQGQASPDGEPHDPPALDVDEAISTLFDSATFVVLVITLLVWLGSSIALFLRHRWARVPYLIVTLLFPLFAFAGPSSPSPVLADFFDDCSLLFPGFIIGLCYFAPVRFRDMDPA